jgi:uncharacterized protein YidB (DUF937 family)
MGLFDSFAANLLGQLTGGRGGADSPLLGMALQFIQSYPGGLSGLLEKFRAAGLTNEVQSWISTGGNLPISADQLGRVLGNDQIGSFASQLGMNAGDVTKGLAQLFPQLVDNMSPQGSLPHQDAMRDGLGELLNLLRK